MAAHVFDPIPGERLCRTCGKPSHCDNCDEGLLPWESHRYLNRATRRWEFSCVRRDPPVSSPPVVHGAAVHHVRPVRR